MSEYQRLVLDGITEFQSIADEWDDLWGRSYARLPAARSACVRNWIQSFAAKEPLTTICIRTGGRLVAGITLLRGATRGGVPCYHLPVNCWANSGDLLLDVNVEADPVLQELFLAIESIRPGLMSFHEIFLEGPQWVGFQRIVQQCRGFEYVSQRRSVGIVDVLHDWERYEKSWSGNHRGAVKRSYRKLSQQGELRAERYCSPSDDQLEQLLNVAFEIEDRSWKGNAGSSVLKTPGMLEFIFREAREMARSGCLHLWFLYFNDRPIAFEYCHFAKGVCLSHKIGYEPEFAKYGPGRLLRYLQLQSYHADADCQSFDMLGALCESKAKWATRTYGTGRLHVAPGGTWQAGVLRGVAWMHPYWKAIRRRPIPSTPKLGAEKTLQHAADRQQLTSLPTVADSRGEEQQPASV